MLELARLGFTKTGEKKQLAEVYLDLGQVGMENQDYDLDVMDFGVPQAEEGSLALGLEVLLLLLF